MVGEEEGAVLPTGLEICRVGENGIPQPLAGRWPVLRHVEAVLSSSTAANNDVVAPDELVLLESSPLHSTSECAGLRFLYFVNIG